MPESLPGNRTSPASIISTLKELVALLRDACLLILAVLLIAFPANLNDLLVTAGFKKGSIAGFEWEAVVKSDQALKDALARINELTAQNQQFDQLLKEARARAADPQEKARLQALEDQNRSLRAATAETTSSVRATIASTSAVVAQAQAVVAEHTQWGIVFGGDSTLKEAQYEVGPAARKLGLRNSGIYLRQGSYRSVALTSDRGEAEQLLIAAKRRREDAYIVSMQNWCVDPVPRDGFTECGAARP